MKVVIIGIGLIGGSMALDLKKRGFATKVVGVDSNLEHVKKALSLNLVDEVKNLDEALPGADIVILAIPVQTAQYVLLEVLDRIDQRTVVMDVGSTKVGICASVKGHPMERNFVATHPMAGTEYSGPKSAVENLFDNKVCIICDRDNSGILGVKYVQKLYQTLKMRMIFMNSSSHDEHAAFVSHISHISSFVLALTVLDKEKSEKTIFDLASGGFESTARLAKSSAEMWSQIFIQNDQSILEVLKVYTDYIQNFKEAIEQGDTKALSDLILEANKIKKVLP